MNPHSARPWRAILGSVAALPFILAEAFVVLCLANSVEASAQSMPSGFDNGLNIAAGSMVSGYYLGYGPTKSPGLHLSSISTRGATSVSKARRTG